MAVTRSVGVRNAEADAGMGGTNFNRLALYAAAPTGAGSAQPGTLLATYVLNATPFPAASNGTITANAIADVTAVASGTVASYRLFKSTETAQTSAANTTDRRAEGTVTATGGGGDMTITNTNIASGQTLQASGISFTMPA
jgi:hypothetical protein